MEDVFVLIVEIYNLNPHCCQSGKEKIAKPLFHRRFLMYAGTN